MCNHGDKAEHQHYLEGQAEHRLLVEEHERDRDRDAYTAIELAIRTELNEALRHALQWLPTSDVMRMFATAVERYALAERDRMNGAADDDEPF